jgi:hypothetical protein
MNLLLKVRQLIRIFTWQFWDISGIQYEENSLKCSYPSTIPAFPLISPLLTFYLFPKLKISLKERRFQTVEDIITDAMIDLVVLQTSYE